MSYPTLLTVGYRCAVATFYKKGSFYSTAIENPLHLSVVETPTVDVSISNVGIERVQISREKQLDVKNSKRCWRLPISFHFSFGIDNGIRRFGCY